MGFFSNLKTDRLITEIRGCTDPSNPATQKLVAKLKDGGEEAILPIVAALPDADKPVTVALVEALTSLVNQKTFPKFIVAMVQASPKAVAKTRTQYAMYLSPSAVNSADFASLKYEKRWLNVDGGYPASIGKLPKSPRPRPASPMALTIRRNAAPGFRRK